MPERPPPLLPHDGPVSLVDPRFLEHALGERLSRAVAAGWAAGARVIAAIAVPSERAPKRTRAPGCRTLCLFLTASSFARAGFLRPMCAPSPASRRPLVCSSA